ncbi:Fe-S cluster assembly scaffold SufA [Candidatus Erwinia haradaeae]|uniref:Protein SufA n=1 Tax=Candidatus Erwinia haradaeae TaxID=1922217 RepID=A0A451DNR2_9GAMM|nr:Fe-S cluster assembly scaffold SufA [Candidatus Erwinia haradaeae]VFP88383.1 Protein SufA [Candidatus Erwinia haradaeae]
MPSEKLVSSHSSVPIWKGLTLTHRAAEQISYLLLKEPNIKGVQLDVKTSGCAGLSYTMNLVKEVSKDVLMFSRNRACVFVPLKAMPYIDGTEVDYVNIGLNQVFKFNNPLANQACGCGESFSVE